MGFQEVKEGDGGSFHYGQRVSVHYKGAWREGVVLDQEESRQERVVLLLDSGCRVKTIITNIRTSADRDPVDRSFLINLMNRVGMSLAGDSCAVQISSSDPDDELVAVEDFLNEILMPDSLNQTNPTHCQSSGPEPKGAVTTCPAPASIDQISSYDPDDELGAFADFVNEILIPDSFDQTNPTHCQGSGPEPEEAVMTCPAPARTNPSSSPNPNVVAVEKEYNPQTVADLFVHETSKSSRGKCAGLAELRKKARKHLSYMGWVFWYKDKKGKDKKSKRELRYSSPTGVCYYSLRRACKCAMEEDGASAPVKRIFKPRKTAVIPAVDC